MREEVAISVRDVTKKYRLFASPKDRLKEALHPIRKRYHREFWALKGVSFDVPKGKVVGLLGQNGSGKSTLLQIIVSVLQPTSGTVTVRGRVAALLELGAGFNPEFTGRENVILNGTILGISRDEMMRRAPAIAAFADIGDFFDQPMKIYSSGMFVRVAFAAAVHVDPDILIIDEALAVGDAKFQHKCFQRLADLQAQNKTILFVTHNSSVVTSYCDYAYLLDHGMIVASGDPGIVVDRYYKLLFGDAVNQVYPRNDSAGSGAKSNLGEAGDGLKDLIEKTGDQDACCGRRSYNKNEVHFGSDAARIVDYAVQSGECWDVASIQFGSRVSIFVKVLFCQDVQDPMIGFSVKTLEGVDVYGTNTFILGHRLRPATVGQVCIFKFEFSMFLKPRDYFLDLGVAQVDGTRSGAVITVRRSLAHCVVLLDKECPFEGIIDLAPNFESLTESLELLPHDPAVAQANEL